MLRLGLPAGSLQEATVELLARAGWKVRPSKRSYFPTVDDPELEPVLLRPQEMPRYVEAGQLDAAICGRDWVVENGAEVVEAAALVYAKQSARPVRWVLAVPEDSEVKTVKDLAGRRIATEAVGITRRFLEERGVDARVEFSWGTTEAKVPRFAEAIVDITETGSSLAAHSLRIVETVFESVTVIIASRAAWADGWKRKKVETLALMLQGAIVGGVKVGLKMNARRSDLAAVLKCLTALRRPTVNSLADEDWVAVDTVMNESEVREIVPALKAAGAEGIVEYPLNKVIE